MISMNVKVTHARMEELVIIKSMVMNVNVILVMKEITVIYLLEHVTQANVRMEEHVHWMDPGGRWNVYVCLDGSVNSVN